MTRIPQPPSLKFRSRDLGLRIQNRVISFAVSLGQQSCKDSSDKGYFSVCCVLVSSRGEYCHGICTIPLMTPLSLGVTGGTEALATSSI